MKRKVCQQCGWNYPTIGTCKLCAKKLCDICDSRHIDECSALA